MLKLSLLRAFCAFLSSLFFAVSMAVDGNGEHPARLGGAGLVACTVPREGLRGGGRGSPEARVCRGSQCVRCSPWITKASPNNSVC